MEEGQITVEDQIGEKFGNLVKYCADKINLAGHREAAGELVRGAMDMFRTKGDILAALIVFVTPEKVLIEQLIMEGGKKINEDKFMELAQKYEHMIPDSINIMKVFKQPTERLKLCRYAQYFCDAIQEIKLDGGADTERFSKLREGGSASVKNEAAGSGQTREGPKESKSSCKPTTILYCQLRHNILPLSLLLFRRCP